MMSINTRESLESPLLRHGVIEKLGPVIEKGGKPPYGDFINFMENKVDPPIDKEATRKIVEDKMKEGKINRNDFDIIICSPALRAKQTAELMNDVLGLDAEVHPSAYLREINIPMGEITPEFYGKAKDIYEVRKKFMESFLAGGKIDEDVVDVFKRATRFLTYLRRIRKLTDKKPLFVTHGIYSRFLNLAIDHEADKLKDDEIRDLIKKEFAQTARPGNLGGFELSSSEKGTKIVGLV